MVNGKTDMRFVKVANVVYVRKDDIVSYLENMAEYEPHDEFTHDASLRLKEAAKLLGEIGCLVKQK
jgi:hypothetical protein